MREVKEILKLVVDSMKNETLYQLLKNDTEFQEKSEKKEQALKAVEELELTENQRQTVNTLMAAKDEIEYDFRVNSYMAGILDGYEILKKFNLTRE